MTAYSIDEIINAVNMQVDDSQLIDRRLEEHNFFDIGHEAILREKVMVEGLFKDIEVYFMICAAIGPVCTQLHGREMLLCLLE